MTKTVSTITHSLILSLTLGFAGCATMFNDSSEDVKFVGAPQKGTTTISTPSGKISIKDGEVGVLHMKRSRKNVPITVGCPNKTTKSGEIITEFDYLVGGVVNLLNIPIGWIVDAFSNKAFIYNPVNVADYCDSEISKKKNPPLSGVGIE